MEEETTTPKEKPSWRHVPDDILEKSVTVRLDREGYEQLWAHISTCEVCRERLWEVTEHHKKRVEGLAKLSRGVGTIISSLMSSIDKASEAAEEGAGRSLFEFLTRDEEDEEPGDMKKDLDEAGFPTPEAFVQKVLTMVPNPKQESVKNLFLAVVDKIAKRPAEEGSDLIDPDEIGLRFNRKKEHMMTCIGCQARVISTMQLCAYYQDKVDTDERRDGVKRLQAFLKTYQADMFKDVPIVSAMPAPEEQSEAAPVEKNRVFTQP